MARWVEIEGTAQLREAAARLKAAGRGDVIKALTKSIRSTTKTAADDVKTTVRALPIQGGRGGGRAQRAAHLAGRSRGKDQAKNLRLAHKRSGLREATARAVTTSVRAGAKSANVKVRVRQSVMPPDQRKLPYWMEKGTWRHPVFGNRHWWVTQTAKPNWFAGTLRAHGPRVRSGIAAAVGDALDKI